MTATPVDRSDAVQYFGNPIYTYSLRQGIEDGFSGGMDAAGR